MPTPDINLSLVKCFKLTEEAFINSLNSISNGKLLFEARNDFKKYIVRSGANLEHYALFSNGLGFIENGNYCFENNKIVSIDSGIIYEDYIN